MSGVLLFVLIVVLAVLIGYNCVRKKDKRSDTPTQPSHIQLVGLQ